MNTTSDDKLYVQPSPATPARPLAEGVVRAPFLGVENGLEAVRVLKRGPEGVGGEAAICAPEPSEAARRYGDKVADLIEATLRRVAEAPSPVAGVSMDRPRIMGVLNVTPDSFSDGGQHLATDRCLSRARAMAAAGVDFFDIGGESTRPGAELVAADVEKERILPAIEAIRSVGLTAPISVDTRKPEVARAAFASGARIWNDVSSLGYATDGLATAADLTSGSEGGWICLMHAQGDPKTMQDSPQYKDALLDVYDLLARRLEQAVAAGVPEARVILDPGIGFGKTLEHNIAIFQGLSLYASLGAPILIGASRKRFIGALSGETAPERRAPGSIAAALWSAAQGARILRVHDVEETAQALSVWSALVSVGNSNGASL